MKVHFLIESEQESAEREANLKCELFRGVSGTLRTFTMIRLPIRTDRRPRDSTYMNQLLFNAIFEMVHGVKDIRARSMFCIGDFDVAQSYAGGDGSDEYPVLSVYPLNTAKCAFNEQVDDSLELMDAMSSDFTGGIQSLFNETEHQSTVMAGLHDLQTGAVSNCLEQFTGFIDTVKGLCDPKQSHVIEEIIDSLKQKISHYQILPGTRAHEANGSVEVMVFDAAYYYGKLADEAHGDYFID